ncbi:histone-lysine N-methyltransferase SETMAR [Trichonephila clavipes]|nr:histone-lysine N-methyltransferase SETMAR [Trichonephila clavipes]
MENVDKITEIIEIDRHVSSCSITQELKIGHKTVLSHLSKVGFKKKIDVWAPHQLTPQNMIDRISICEALAKRNEIDPFLNRMVIGDEKWVTYDNVVRKRSWSKRGEAAQTVTKPGLKTRKGQKLNLDIYCEQLHRLKLLIDQKWPELADRGVVFQQDNVRPRTSVVTHQKLWELEKPPVDKEPVIEEDLPTLKPPKNPSLKLLWLVMSSMMAVQEGSCQYCPTHNGLYPNIENCKCYYKCIEGKPIQKWCPPGQKFDVMSMSCSFPSKTVCAGARKGPNKLNSTRFDSPVPKEPVYLLRPGPEIFCIAYLLSPLPAGWRAVGGFSVQQKIDGGSVV